MYKFSPIGIPLIPSTIVPTKYKLPYGFTEETKVPESVTVKSKDRAGLSLISTVKTPVLTLSAPIISFFRNYSNYNPHLSVIPKTDETKLNVDEYIVNIVDEQSREDRTAYWYGFGNILLLDKPKNFYFAQIFGHCVSSFHLYVNNINSVPNTSSEFIVKNGKWYGDSTGGCHIKMVGSGNFIEEIDKHLNKGSGCFINIICDLGDETYHANVLWFNPDYTINRYEPLIGIDITNSETDSDTLIQNMIDTGLSVYLTSKIPIITYVKHSLSNSECVQFTRGQKRYDQLCQDYCLLYVLQRLRYKYIDHRKAAVNLVKMGNRIINQIYYLYRIIVAHVHKI